MIKKAVIISFAILFQSFIFVNAKEPVEKISISIAQSGPFKQIDELDFSRLNEQVERLKASGSSVEIVLAANFNQKQEVEKVLARLKEFSSLKDVPVIQILSE